MTDDLDEFSFLPVQAAEIGVTDPLPHAERVNLTLPDGRTLSALRYGDAPPEITLLHGAGLNAHTWDTTILAAGIPALAIDLAGHGDSSWRDDAGYVPPALSPDVIAALEAWTDRPQLLVGHSLGGLTAAAVAASRPDLVRALVVIDISPGIDANGGASQLREFFAGPTDWADRDELVARALSFGLGGSSAAAARGVFFNSRVRADGRVEWKHHFARIANRMASDLSIAGTAAVSQDAVAAALTARGWDDLAALTMPVTLIRGDHGFLTTADEAEFAERVPAASIVVVPSGHNVQEQLPVALGARLRDLAGMT
jgi:pimeloyl-ACP methyl ester carboxylesterase